jgi:hypothetical protein
MRGALALVVLVCSLALAGMAAAAENPVVGAMQRSVTADSAVVKIDAVNRLRGGGSFVMTGTGRQRGQEISMSVRLHGSGLDTTMELVGLREPSGYVMYIRSPLFGSQLPAGKSWLRVDLAKEGRALGIDFDALLDVSESTLPVRRGLVSSRLLGREAVAGRNAKHYRVVVDLERVAAAVPSYRRQLRALEKATGVDLGRQSQDVWVGADGRLARLRYTSPAANGAVMTQTLTYTAYGVPVRITAPPAESVFDPSTAPPA